jgi:hypothetical protein
MEIAMGASLAKDEIKTSEREDDLPLKWRFGSGFSINRDNGSPSKPPSEHNERGRERKKGSRFVRTRVRLR